MTIKEWENEHKDAIASIHMIPNTLVFEFSVKLPGSDKVKRRAIDMAAIPFTSDEVVLEDYICGIYEILYSSLKREDRIESV